MPTPRKTTTTPKKRAPRKAARPAAEPVTPQGRGIAEKRAQMRGEDGPGVDPYAPTVWGAQTTAGALEDVQLPSGQLCLAQKPGPEGLMTAGLLDDLDMISTVLPKVAGGKGTAKDFDARQVMKNPTMMKQALALMDRIVVHIVVKPEITPEPDSPADRELGKIYPSSVAMEDKVFLFNWAVGGTRDVAKFRQQFEESVAGLDAGEDVESPTK